MKLTMLIPMASRASNPTTAINDGASSTPPIPTPPIKPPINGAAITLPIWNRHVAIRLVKGESVLAGP
jgi:hypothetical protein